MSREQQEYWEVQAWRHEVEYFARIEKQPTATHKLPHNVTENTIPF